MEGKINDKHFQGLLTADIIIIDEVSMLTATALSGINSGLNYVASRGISTVELDGIEFGGKSIVCVGDLYQLPAVQKYRVEEPAPVVEGEAPASEAEVRIVESAVHTDDFSFLDETARADVVALLVQGEEGEEPAAPEPLKFVITETQRLRFMMQNISSGTDVVSLQRWDPAVRPIPARTLVLRVLRHAFDTAQVAWESR
jgi:hypothetical protein